MNVTCEKCSTDYDLDEARVGESGLTVKCTHCGHIFRVEGEDEDPFSDGPLGSMELETPKLGMWRVRRRGGEELSFDDFATLRLWITERRVSRDDEISKTGDSWKPIGSIIELASLFDDAVPPIETPDDSGEAPPPPINREDLLDVSDVRLAGLDAKSDIIASGMFDPLDIEPPRPSAPREDKGSIAPAIPDLPLDGEIRRPPPLPGRRKAASAGAPPVVQPPSRRSSLGDRPAPGDRLIADRPSMVGRMPDRPAMGGRLPPPPRRPSGARVGGRDSVVGRPPPRASANRLPPHRDSVPNTRMDGAPPRRRESVVVAGRRQPPGRPSRGPGLPPHRDAPPGELNMGFESEAPPMYAGQNGGNNGTGRGFLMGVLTMLAVAGVGYFIYDNYVAPDRGQPPPPPPVVADRGPDVGATLDRAEAAYARDTEIALAESVQHYDDALRALGTPPSDPAQAGRAHVGRARVALARAEYALIDGDKTSSAAHLATADRALAVARTLGQDVTQLQLALADYHRINGEIDLARNYIDQLRGNAAVASQVALIEAALGLHGGKPGDAADQLGVLPAETKRLPRAIYLHAAALKAADRIAESRGALEVMLANNPGHEPGRRLLDSLPVPGEPADAEVKAPVEPPKVDPPKVDPPKADPPKKAPTSSKPTGSFDSLMDRGNALLERGKVKQARKLFRAAADKRGSSPEPWASLGWCELDQGRHRKAVTYFERALRKNPRYADAMYGQATAYDRGGMKTQAKQAYQAYLNVHPRGSKASIIKRKLARMP